jgi:putative membrane protein
MIDWGREMFLLLSSVGYAVLGMILLLIAYKIFDWATPHDLDVVLFQEKNLAVAAVVAAFLLSLAIIIHAAIN